MTHRRHLLSILVENRFGELARIVGLFSGRGFNIDSLVVNTTLDPSYSRVVLETRGDAQIIEQIVKQLHKLIRVRRVHEFHATRHLERELCLVTVPTATAAAREDLERVARLAGARVIAFAAARSTLEYSGSSREVEEFLETVKPLGIKEMVRTAPVWLSRPAAGASAAEDEPHE